MTALRVTDSAFGQIRYTFTAQFIEAAAIFVRKAADIEANHSGTLSEPLRSEHRGFVSTAIMQCAAALETEAHEICAYGPASYQGSIGKAQRLLAPLADFIDDQDTLTRYRIIFHILQIPVLDSDREPFQSAQLVIRLRNEITHYKSRWGEEMSRSKLFRALEELRHKPPSFTQPNQNFFPHRCLGAECGVWAVRSTVAFLDEVYRALGVTSRFEPYRQRIMLPN